MSKTVICGASAYEEKYYFNEEQFGKIPQQVKDELRVICILFTQDAGGVFTIAIDDDGELIMETESEEWDITYDDIAAGMLVGAIRRERAELLESLQNFARIFL